MSKLDYEDNQKIIQSNLKSTIEEKSNCCKEISDYIAFNN